ncbi:outer membrane lipoprotein-sorting protein [Flavobacterium sp.]|uniref:outer membrane lipoprotein-sorting protein n=1 Tax=Flavobacterium sp. TaxID=239 RepID=UPI00374FEDD8
MKKLSLLLKTIVVSLTFFSAQAQNVDDVVNKYIETIGGKEKLEAIKSVKMEMIANYQGMEIPVEVCTAKDGKMLVKINLMGKEMTQVAFDGTSGWSTNMMTMKAEKMNSEDIENMKNTASNDFPDPFLNYKSKGYKAEYIAKETKEGTECHKIKLTKLPQTINGEKVDDVSFYYFDVENNVIVLTETEIKEGQMKGQMASSTAGNYQEVEGVYFPFTISQYGQEMTVKKITLNPTIDPKALEFKAE